MAIKATIFKANLQIADMERHYYQDHALTLARHPSETDERMMVRLLAFALHAHEYLEFGQGMTNDDEADLWQKDLTGAIELWIDVGIPDEKLIRKACGRCQPGGGVLLWRACRRHVVRAEQRSVRTAEESHHHQPAGGKHAGAGQTGATLNEPAMHHSGWASVVKRWQCKRAGGTGDAENPGDPEVNFTGTWNELSPSASKPWLSLRPDRPRSGGGAPQANARSARVHAGHKHLHPGCGSPRHRATR